MLHIWFFFLLLSNAINSRRDRSILYSRITILILSSILAISALFLTFLDKGIGLYGGLFHFTALTHNFHLFIFVISAVIMQLTSQFYSERLVILLKLNKSYNLLQWCLKSPLKSHAFVSLYLQCGIVCKPFFAILTNWIFNFIYTHFRALIEDRLVIWFKGFFILIIEHGFKTACKAFYLINMVNLKLYIARLLSLYSVLFILAYNLHSWFWLPLTVLTLFIFCWICVLSIIYVLFINKPENRFLSLLLVTFFFILFIICLFFLVKFSAIMLKDIICYILNVNTGSTSKKGRGKNSGNKGASNNSKGPNKPGPSGNNGPGAESGESNKPKKRKLTGSPDIDNETEEQRKKRKISENNIISNEKLKNDPEKYEKSLEQNRMRSKKRREEIKSDPEKHEKYLEQDRKGSKKRREEIKSDPEKYEKSLEQKRKDREKIKSDPEKYEKSLEQDRNRKKKDREKIKSDPEKYEKSLEQDRKRCKAHYREKLKMEKAKLDEEKAHVSESLSDNNEISTTFGQATTSGANPSNDLPDNLDPKMLELEKRLIARIDEWNKSHDDNGVPFKQIWNEIMDSPYQSGDESRLENETEQSNKDSDTSTEQTKKDSDTSSLLSEYFSDAKSEDDDNRRVIKRSLKEQEKNLRNERAKFESSKNNEKEKEKVES